MMTTALDLIKRHEGLRLNAYRCPAGVWTIGYGHTVGVKDGDYMSVDEALTQLDDDVAAVRKSVRALALESGVTLSRHQEDALVSFTFNVGLTALRKSTLWKLVAENPSNPDIATEFARWIYSNGKVLPGLVKRRTDESRLYFFGS